MIPKSPVAPHGWRPRTTDLRPSDLSRCAAEHGLSRGAVELLQHYHDFDRPDSSVDGARKGVVWPGRAVLFELLRIRSGDCFNRWRNELVAAGLVVPLDNAGGAGRTAVVALRYDRILGHELQGLLAEPEPTENPTVSRLGKPNRLTVTQDTKTEKLQDPDPDSAPPPTPRTREADADQVSQAVWLRRFTELPPGRYGMNQAALLAALRDLADGRAPTAGGVHLVAAYGAIWHPLDTPAKLSRFRALEAHEWPDLGTLRDADKPRWGDVAELAAVAAHQVTAADQAAEVREARQRKTERRDQLARLAHSIADRHQVTAYQTLADEWRFRPAPTDRQAVDFRDPASREKHFAAADAAAAEFRSATAPEAVGVTAQ